MHQEKRIKDVIKQFIEASAMFRYSSNSFNPL